MSDRYTTLHGIYQVMSSEKKNIYIYILIRIFDRKFNQIQEKKFNINAQKNYDLKNKA